VSNDRSMLAFSWRIDWQRLLSVLFSAPVMVRKTVLLSYKNGFKMSFRWDIARQERQRGSSSCGALGTSNNSRSIHWCSDSQGTWNSRQFHHSQEFGSIGNLNTFIIFHGHRSKIVPFGPFLPSPTKTVQLSKWPVGLGRLVTYRNVGNVFDQFEGRVPEIDSLEKAKN
jgi:hypothetical protein